MKHSIPVSPNQLQLVPPDGQRLLKSREAAHFLCICERTLWTIRKEGRLPFVEMRRCIRYKLEDLMRYADGFRPNTSTQIAEAA